MEHLFEAAEDGHLYVVERTTKAGKDIVAAAGLFRIATAEFVRGGNPIEVYELAGTVINGPVAGGFGLQKILTDIRVISMARAERENVCLITSVDAENTRSLSNVVEAGLIACDAPEWLNSVHRSWCGDRGAIRDLIVAPAATMVMAKRVTTYRKPFRLERVNRTGGIDRVIVSFQANWIQGDEPMNAIIGGETPDWSSEIPPIRLIGHGPNWIRLNSNGNSQMSAAATATVPQPPRPDSTK